MVFVRFVPVQIHHLVSLARYALGETYRATSNFARAQVSVGLQYWQAARVAGREDMFGSLVRGHRLCDAQELFESASGVWLAKGHPNAAAALSNLASLKLQVRQE